jgi:hypothetical protein
LLLSVGPPAEHVVIFDEAQNAWNLWATADFMRRKKKRPALARSEPEFLNSCMDRHVYWAFIVCPVGGAQEIHAGEAGIYPWIEAVNFKVPPLVHLHFIQTDRQPVRRRRRARGGAASEECAFDNSLHLAVSMRSFRAESVSAFVKAMLDCEKGKAAESYRQLCDLCNAYRVLLTRARQGMVIYVPARDSGDPTRSPGFYDPAFGYLREIGIRELG